MNKDDRLGLCGENRLGKWTQPKLTTVADTVADTLPDAVKIIRLTAIENARQRSKDTQDIKFFTFADYESALTTGFEDGALYEYCRILKWRNPRISLPDDDVEVLCMIHRKFQTYTIARHDDNGWWQPLHPQEGISLGGWIALEKEPIAWRYIKEYEL